MRALLLAAGQGTRLRPVTWSVPKCLVPIGGRALLDYWFELLFRGGVERALVNTSYLAAQVRGHVTACPWREQVDLVHEEALLGTGGTVLANADYFDNSTFLVIHADNLTDCSILDLLAAHSNRPQGCAMTMLAFRADQPQLCGILELDRHGVVQKFHEKQESPPGNLANGAVYVFEPEIIDFIASFERPVVDLSTEVIPAFLGRIFAVEHKGYHRDIGNLASLEQARRDMERGQLRFGGAMEPVEGRED
ncbi:nucleotidyltransferase family protein [Acidocella sp.]|jgi:mannose-1-phosphate guanylyltransferase|uniref:nucleotidyltransferase family protein n=1 Tax=Acidocella sp. TaxID=50710 RepID=UPI002F3EB58C